MTASRIFMIGYRGTGKTTIGPVLARRLGWSFVDADERTEATAGRSIAEIFTTEGEPGFRDRESATLAETCGLANHVVATGGGVILRPANRELLRASGFVVWLTASPETILARLDTDPTTRARRPNLTAAGGLAEIRTLLAAREPLYHAAADFTLATDILSPDAAADAILSAWTGSPTSPSASAASTPSSSA
jgi:shikimate kinase